MSAPKTGPNWPTPEQHFARAEELLATLRDVRVRLTDAEQMFVVSLAGAHAQLATAGLLLQKEPKNA